MVSVPRGGRLDLPRCGVSWNASGMVTLGRVRHPVQGIAASAAKVFRIRANPGAWIDRDLNGSQAEL